MVLGQNTVADGAEKGLPPGTSFEDATKNLQAAARWIVTALAAVGAVLVAGIPLTALGKVNGWAAVFAFGSLFAALVAIGFAIPAVAKVFTTPYVTLTALTQDELPTRKGQDTSRVAAIVEKIHRSREELFGDQAEDLGVLHSRLKAVNDRLRRQRGARREDLENPGPPHGALAAPADVDMAHELRATAERVLDFANYEATRRIFVGLYRKLAFAGLIAVLGVSFYAYTVNRPSSSVVITSPRPVVLSLPIGSAEAKRLGKQCDVRKVAAVALEGALRRPTVSTIPSLTCASAVFLVPEGTVVVPTKDLPSLPGR
ncbi:hypothetical protein ACFWBN_20555 [Streptomyces sp. NPDC059989]|uniref:hypothetical protein n=1 Tax=Streptomyces sp. NPDC059989 TaxID=3347026 RepID=UPI0036BC02A5